jgi:ribose transport system permease protein
LQRTVLANVLRRGTVLLVLLVLLVFFSAASELFFQGQNLTNILTQSSPTILVAAGLTLTMLVGGIDLSVGSVAALVGAVSAGLIVRNLLPVWVGILGGLALGALLGAVNGGLIVFGRLPPFVATLAMLGVARGLTLVYTEGRPISGMGEEYTFLGSGEIALFGERLGVPTPVIIVTVVIFLVWLLLTRTTFGLRIYAIGGNEETARLAGVPVRRVKILTYALSGLLAALCGVLLTARLYSAQPQVGVGLELDAIAASVLGGVSLFGGVGNIWGTVIGALLVGVLGNGLTLLRVASYPQQVIQGVVLVLAVSIDMFAKRLEQH